MQVYVSICRYFVLLQQEYLGEQEYVGICMYQQKSVSISLQQVFCCLLHQAACRYMQVYVCICMYAYVCYLYLQVLYVLDRWGTETTTASPKHPLVTPKIKYIHIPTHTCKYLLIHAHTYNIHEDTDILHVFVCISVYMQV